MSTSMTMRPSTSPLPCQRHLFDIPRDVAYLTAASWSPLPLAVMEAGRAGVLRKGQPWKLAPDLATQQHERARRAAARLINASPDDIALIPSVAYGVATAAKLLAVPAGSRVLVLADDHGSPVLEWSTRAPRQGFTVEAIVCPRDGDRTAALLAAIDRPGATPVALASISSVHWADGGIVELAPVAAALRARGAKLLVDATHSAGMQPLDVKTLDPDILVFPTYKWLLGPYGRAFLYVARRHQDGEPLEQPPTARREFKAEARVYAADTRYLPDARRFDMGERDHFVSLEMASVGMELVAGWGSAPIAARLAMLTDRLAAGVAELGLPVLPRRVRAANVLTFPIPETAPPDLIARLAAERVYVAPRLGRVRISPHVYNDEADIDRCLSALHTVLR